MSKQAGSSSATVTNQRSTSNADGATADGDRVRLLIGERLGLLTPLHREDERPGLVQMWLDPEDAHLLKIVNSVLVGDGPGRIPSWMVNLASHPSAMDEMKGAW
jgi:hypothetical protein